MRLFELRVVIAVVLAVVGMWTMASFERIGDLSAYRGGTDCMQRRESVNCDSYTSSCIRCTTTSKDLRCVTYQDEYNCIACNDGPIKDCGGSTQQGVAVWYATYPPIFAGCINWQDAGLCSRTYMEAQQANCSPGKTC